MTAFRTTMTLDETDDTTRRRYRELRPSGVVEGELYLDIATFQELGEPESLRITIQR